jgi:hypothetical protein
VFEIRGVSDEVFAHCVDIGGIVDHHCLNFLFINNEEQQLKHCCIFSDF